MVATAARKPTTRKTEPTGPSAEIQRKGKGKAKVEVPVPVLACTTRPAPVLTGQSVLFSNPEVRAFVHRQLRAFHGKVGATVIRHPPAPAIAVPTCPRCGIAFGVELATTPMTCGCPHDICRTCANMLPFGAPMCHEKCDNLLPARHVNTLASDILMVAEGFIVTPCLRCWQWLSTASLASHARECYCVPCIAVPSKPLLLRVDDVLSHSIVCTSCNDAYVMGAMLRATHAATLGATAGPTTPQ
jgi:hypothetical protein